MKSLQTVVFWFEWGCIKVTDQVEIVVLIMNISKNWSAFISIDSCRNGNTFLYIIFVKFSN